MQSPYKTPPHVARGKKGVGGSAFDIENLLIRTQQYRFHSSKAQYNVGSERLALRRNRQARVKFQCFRPPLSQAKIRYP
jgi:hypothetical protein